MTKVEIYATVLDAIESVNAVVHQLERIKEALNEKIDWEALNNPGESRLDNHSMILPQ